VVTIGDLPRALTISNSAYCVRGFYMIIAINSDCYLKSNGKLISIMEKSCIFFEVRAEFLNVIQASFCLK
jgi:hypothetical protein